jgi:hypothetical protein
MPPQLHTAHGNALAIFNLHHISGRVLQKVEEGYLRGQRTKVSFREDFEKRAHRQSQSGTSQIVQVVANLLLLYVSEEFLLLNLNFTTVVCQEVYKFMSPSFHFVPHVCCNINSNLNIVQMFVCDKSHCSANVPVCVILSIQGMQRMNMNGYTYSTSIYTKNAYVLVQSNLKYPSLMCRKIGSWISGKN